MYLRSYHAQPSHTVMFQTPLFLQLVNLFLAEEWSTYMTEYQTSHRKYAEVPPKMVYGLLYK